MHWAVFLCLFLVVLLLVLALLAIEVRVHYKRDGDNDYVELTFLTLAGWLHYRWILPTAKLWKSSGQGEMQFVAPIQGGSGDLNSQGRLSIGKVEVELFFEKLRAVWQRLREFRDEVLRQLKIFRVYDLHWKTEFGAGDAAVTGMLAGIAWAAKGSLVGALSHFFTLRELPHLEVKPFFSGQGFSTDVSCIIRFRLGEAIFAGTKVAIYWIREGRSWSTQ